MGSSHFLLKLVWSATHSGALLLLVFSLADFAKRFYCGYKKGKAKQPALSCSLIKKITLMKQPLTASLERLRKQSSRRVQRYSNECVLPLTKGLHIYHSLPKIYLNTSQEKYTRNSKDLEFSCTMSWYFSLILSIPISSIIRLGEYYNMYGIYEN